MATEIINYTFVDLNLVANPNGSYKASVKGCTVVPGPGSTPMGNYPNAFRFTNGLVHCDMADTLVDSSQFTIRMMVKVNQKVLSRQNLAESTHLPFSIYIDKDPEGGDFIVQASVGTKYYDWSGVNSRFRKTLQKDKWYEICLVYDVNTLGLFIDRALVGIWAFPNGIIEKKTSKLFTLGAWVDKVKFPFNGEIAGFQWYKGIPDNYEALLDSARITPRWHISFKYESIKSKHYLGNESAALRSDADSGCTIQEYQNGWIMYNPAVGAFEIHGAILEHYKSMPSTKRKELSWAVSDEINGKLGQSKKSLFKGGAIYWSPWTPAVAVIGQMYIDYECLGEGLSPIGLPTNSEVGLSGGKYQKFQKGRMYHRTGAANAYEVHGVILERYIALGSNSSVIGWPISHELDVVKNSQVVGKFSSFEGGTIYWKSGIGAFEVHGEIAQRYNDYGGATGPLGFPRTNETDIPNHTGPGKYNVFEGGVIVWYGSMNQTYICPPFQIYFERIETSDEDPWPKGENDIYMHLYVYRNGSEAFHVRKPNSGDYGDHNTKNIDYLIPNTFMPDSATTCFTFRCNAYDADDVDSDDHLGDLSTNLDIHNAWGQRDNNGIFTRQAIKHMKITWAVKPVFDQRQFTDRQWYFWGVRNQGTPELSWAQYAATFYDVTGDPDTLDHILSPLDYAFYHWVYKGIAKGGNCFGMSLEAINAWKSRSMFNGPLNRYSWNQIKNEINIKQAYQIGANAIWWFVGQFLSGNTHDPKDVFTAGRSRAASGDRPIYCIAQNYDFSGKPHAILPWKWDTPGAWKVDILDPNNESGINNLAVNSNANTFNYNNGNPYSGGEWTGGRFHYMPWSVVNGKQRTPIWDAILLLLTGTILILADSGETTSLTNLNGENLDGGKLKATDTSKSKFFVPFHAFNGMNGEFFARKGSALGASFNQTIRGKQAGKFEYGMKNLATAINVESPLQAGEIHNIGTRQLGTTNNLFTVKSAAEKNFKIQYSNSLGNLNDRINVTMDNIKSVPGQEIRVIPRPGLAGIELEGMKGSIKPRIDLEIRLDGKLVKHGFQVDSGKALQLDFSRVLSGNELKIISLEKLGGAITGVKYFKAQ